MKIYKNLAQTSKFGYKGWFVFDEPTGLLIWYYYEGHSQVNPEIMTAWWGPLASEDMLTKIKAECKESNSLEMLVITGVTEEEINDKVERVLKDIGYRYIKEQE